MESNDQRVSVAKPSVNKQNLATRWKCGEQRGHTEYCRVHKMLMKESLYPRYT
jgi:hypothetical protein